MKNREIYIGIEKAEPGDFEKIEATDRFWNDRNRNLEMVKISGEWYLLDGWNGWTYTNCWKCTGRDGLHRADNDLYQLTPAQVGIGEPDEDGDYPQYETVGYKVEPGYK